MFLFNVFALWLTSQILPTLTISGGWQIMLTAGFFLSLLMLIVAPVLKILFIPINLLTFGLLSWLINVAIIYLLTIFVPAVAVRTWIFPGISWQGFVVPSTLISYPFALILTSLTLTLITNLLHSVSES